MTKTIEEEIAELKEKLAILIDIVYQLSDAEIELGGQLVVPYDTKEKINQLKFKDKEHVPLGER